MAERAERFMDHSLFQVSLLVRERLAPGTLANPFPILYWKEENASTSSPLLRVLLFLNLKRIEKSLRFVALKLI